MVTDAPSYSALLTGGGCLVCLTFDTQIHDVISADSAVVDDDIPGPESHGIPLLDLKALLPVILPVSVTALAVLLDDSRGAGCVGHVDISHNVCGSPKRL